MAFEQARLTAMEDKDQRNILIRSAHRLLSELGRVGLYCFQQYVDLPNNYWNKAHTTYHVIESMELLDSKTGDLIARIIDPEAADNGGMAQIANSVTNTAEFDRIMKRWAQLLSAHLARLTAKPEAGS